MSDFCYFDSILLLHGLLNELILYRSLTGLIAISRRPGFCYPQLPDSSPESALDELHGLVTLADLRS